MYAHKFHESGADVTLLARGARYEWLNQNGLVLRNEMTGTEERSRVKLVSEIASQDDYDLVIVLIRKTRLPAVFKSLAPCANVRNILFMGNNASGFHDYTSALSPERVVFGFPGAGGGLRDQVLHYADRESRRSKPRPVVIGEASGEVSERLLAIKSLFESAGVTVDTPDNIDGWLKYHVALVSPLVGALYKHDCDNHKAARDRETLRSLVRAAKEGDRVLTSLGFGESAPSEFKLMKWLPEFMSRFALSKMLESKFADVAFNMHAASATDEMLELAEEFRTLIEQVSGSTPNIDSLNAHTEAFARLSTSAVA